MTPQRTSGSVSRRAAEAGPRKGQVRQPRRTARRRLGLAGLLLAVMAASWLSTGRAQAGTFSMLVCGLSGSPAPFSASAGGGMSATAACGNGGAGYEINAPGGHVGLNQAGSWNTTAPAGISIVHAYTQYDRSAGVGSGNGYFGEFYWDGGTSAQITNAFSTYGCCQANFSSQHLGWTVICRFNSGCNYPAYVYVGQINITLSETQAPSITGSGALWNSSGWVRGTWQVGFGASDPSGICSSSIALGGQGIGGPGAAPNQGNYQQCPDALWATNIDTSRSGTGAMGLGISATNAAGVSGNVARTVYVDNTRPSLRLSGPALAYANAGVQYVNVTASAGPSGVSGISCSVDGGAYQYFPGSATSIGIAGAGVHRTTCVAYNNARDAAGNVAASAPQSATTTIIEPTLSAIWFPTIRNPLRCRTVRRRQKVAAHYKYLRRHHKRVRVRVRAHYRTVKVADCRARVVRRRVAYWTTVRRRHHRKRVKHYRYVRSVVFPSAGHSVAKHARFRAGTTIQGWLGTSWLAPLPAQPLTIYAAPDNGQGRFVPVTYALTGSNGIWTATLPPGPSRIVEVAYGGGAGGAVIGSVSGQIKLKVTAPVRLIRTPRKHVHWGSRLRFVGDLPGGYVPQRGEHLRVRLGIGSAHTTVATIATRPDGRFGFSFRFGAGNVVRRYWFQFLTLPEGDYPFTPGASRKVYVTVG
jgi:hypothetical protein